MQINALYSQYIYVKGPKGVSIFELIRPVRLLDVFQQKICLLSIS